MWSVQLYINSSLLSKAHPPPPPVIITRSIVLSLSEYYSHIVLGYVLWVLLTRTYHLPPTLARCSIPYLAHLVCEQLLCDYTIYGGKSKIYYHTWCDYIATARRIFVCEPYNINNCTSTSLSSDMLCMKSLLVHLPLNLSLRISIP